MSVSVVYFHVLFCEMFLSDRDRLAVNNEAARPVTVPQAKRSPRLGSRSPKVKKSRPKQPVPDIEVTYANVSNAIGLKQDERIYDNAKNVIYMNVGKPGEVYRPEREETRGLYGLDLSILTLAW